EASGHLYLCGGDVNGGSITGFDLNADPASPTWFGQADTAFEPYCHDAQVITYTSGPYAGMEVAFAANGGAGLYIYEVVAGQFNRLSSITYPNLAYCHQV
ncbi:MAG: hypothetical protein GTN83_05230, partial [Acidobacteria bacterium]|nr:hypothetical protein [Acidobacteriota bacterium]